MIDHILIAIGEERMDAPGITEHAVEIAAGVDADVTLFRAYREKEFEKALKEFGFESADPADIAKRHRVVREAAEVVRDAGLDLTIAGGVGNPGTALTEYVEDHNIDHVFIGGRRRSPAGKLMFGSIGQDIILQVDVPVTVMLLG